MKLVRNIIFIVTAIFLMTSCNNDAVIPRDTMSDIYYDIYIADQLFTQSSEYKDLNDSTNLYVAIINKYGFTEEDYQKSLDFYMIRPDKFEKIFIKTKKKLEKRKVELERQLAAEEKVVQHWGFLDSLEMFTSDTVQRNNMYYSLRILMFEPDTCVPNSPEFDSVFAERPQNPFMIFPKDTVPYQFRTYLSKPIPKKLIKKKNSDTSNHDGRDILKEKIKENFMIEEDKPTKNKLRMGEFIDID